MHVKNIHCFNPRNVPFVPSPMNATFLPLLCNFFMNFSLSSGLAPANMFVSGIPTTYMCVFMFMYIYVYLCMHVCVRIYIYTYINTFIYIYIYTSIYTDIHTYVYIYIYICVFISQVFPYRPVGLRTDHSSKG
jgi:hypothetical protein